MSLLAKLDEDYIVAYKAKDAVRLNVLRHLRTALKNFQVEYLRAPTDDDALTLIGKQCKQRMDSIEQYKSVGRNDLADNEAAEMAVLRGYMPEQLEGDALLEAVRAAVAEAGAQSPRDMGRVMQILNAAHKGRLDGRAASEAVKAALASL